MGEFGSTEGPNWQDSIPYNQPAILIVYRPLLGFGDNGKLRIHPPDNQRVQ